MSKLTIRFALLIALSWPIWLHSQTYELHPAPFNSQEADFGGTYLFDAFVFTSSRQKTAITYNQDTLHQFFTDLYLVKPASNGGWQNPISLSGHVNTLMNEAQCTFSQTGASMYYTGNLKNALTKKKEKLEKYELGIFHATQYNKEWIDDGEFPYNSIKSEYSCGHPCLANGDSTLYFSSNKPGGYGGSDIYYCTWNNNKWMEPINMGPIINTEGNEFFPFINEFGVFYFTSDSREDSRGMDIYYCTQIEGEMQEPQRLQEPINTNADDFAYTEKKGSNKGCISSNRDGDNDDLYFFTKYEDNYTHCLTNQIPYLCYSISDENYPRIDSLPYVYEWQLSDGTTHRGHRIEHCFPDYGTYQIALNIRDTLTKNLVMNASNQEISILKPQDPYIEAPVQWAVQKMQSIACIIPQVGQVDTTQVHWYLNDQAIGTGLHLDYIPQTTGEQLLTVRLKTKATKKTSSRKLCIEQPIQILEDSLLLPSSKFHPLALALPDGIKSTTGTRVIPKYYLCLAEQSTPLSEGDTLLNNLKQPVTEMHNSENYIYVIEEFDDLESLLHAHDKCCSEGRTYQIVKSLTLDKLYQPIRTIHPNHTEAPIVAHTRVTSKDQITQTEIDHGELRSLRYSAAVMAIEPDISLEVTCYYNDTDNKPIAEANAQKIRQQLLALNVEIGQVKIATQLTTTETIDHPVRLILQYPY